MEFFNCDGSRAELCGNGLRCAALFAYEHRLARETSITFATGGGELAAEVIGNPANSIGEQMYLSKIYMDTAELFAWTLTVILLSTVFEKAVLWLLRRVGK